MSDTCQAGYKIEGGYCLRCGASAYDTCGELDPRLPERHETGLEIIQLRRSVARLKEINERLEHLVECIKAVLNTEESGDDLVAVARAAHQAEQELAALTAAKEQG